MNLWLLKDSNNFLFILEIFELDMIQNLTITILLFADVFFFIFILQGSLVLGRTTSVRIFLSKQRGFHPAKNLQKFRSPASSNLSPPMSTT